MRNGKPIMIIATTGTVSTCAPPTEPTVTFEYKAGYEWVMVEPAYIEPNPLPVWSEYYRADYKEPFIPPKVKPPTPAPTQGFADNSKRKKGVSNITCVSNFKNRKAFFLTLQHRSMVAYYYKIMKYSQLTCTKGDVVFEDVIKTAEDVIYPARATGIEELQLACKADNFSHENYILEGHYFNVSAQYCEANKITI